MTIRTGWKLLPGTTTFPSSGAKKVSAKRIRSCPGCAECARRAPMESISFSRQTLHNARSGYLRILYPYHPCFGQTFEVFGSAGGLRDLVYVRMPNNATRGIPAWMFDETICASIRCADRPMIDCQALLKLAQLLDLQVESRGSGRHESSFAQSKIASKARSSPDDTDAGEVASKRSNTKRRSK
jgi:hypothetical protein